MGKGDTWYYREADGNILKLDVFRDEDPPDPRVEYDNVSTIVCFHGRYRLGDVRTNCSGPAVIIPHTNVPHDNSRDGAEAFAEWARRHLKEGDVTIAEIELYDHSGITIRVAGWDNDAFGFGRTGWDSCVVGWAFVTEGRAREELNVCDGEDWRDKAREHIRREVKEYASFLEGNVYGYELSRLESYEIVENGKRKIRFPEYAVWIEVDSCGGFYGSDHEKSGLLGCVTKGAVRIDFSDLPDSAKEAE